MTLTSATNLIPKPSGMRGLLGVTLDPTSPSMRRSLEKYNFGERDGRGELARRAYHVIGQNISIEPFQICAGNYRVHYIAGPTVLSGDSDPIDTVLEPYDDYAVIFAAIRAVDKLEGNSTALRKDLDDTAKEADEFFAMMDGDDPDTITDADARGPVYWAPP